MLVFLKLGGSLITDKRREETARPDTLRRLAQEVRAAREAQPHLRLLLGHGSGSFGHFAAERTRLLARPGFDPVVYAQVGAAAARLNRIVTDLFVAEGVPVVSLPPSALAWCENGQLRHLALRPIETLLASGAVPLVHGDVALDSVRGATIVSTEEVFVYLARALRPACIVLAGNVAGVFTADPTQDPDTHPIAEITPATCDEIIRGLGGSAGIDVTGGMLTKVRAMVELVREQPALKVYVISGREPGNVKRVLLGRPIDYGTLIRADNPVVP